MSQESRSVGRNWVMLGATLCAAAVACGGGSSLSSHPDGASTADGRRDGSGSPPPKHCQMASDCAAPTPVCDVADGICVGCGSDADCPSGGHCDPVSHRCQGSCATPADCSGNTPICDPGSHTCVARGNGTNNCTPPTSVTLSPANLMATVSPGQTFTQAFTATAHFASGPDQDVTSTAFFSVSDPSEGTFMANTFTWGANHGGDITVSGLYCGVAGTTTLSLNMAASIGTTGVDPQMASGQFMGPASTNASCAPTLLYPPDGALIPPNTNVVEVHFLPGTGNNIYEVSFTNSVTNVRIYTSCTGTTVADGQPLNGGCIFELSQAEWDYVARSNRDGDPVVIQVRALGCDGANVAASAMRQISFAKEDLVGTIYYWASQRAVDNGQSVFSGGVYRYDYGVRDQMADPVLTPNMPASVQPDPNPSNLCIGCHAVSRDGRQMAFLFDDNDADDEYGDVRADVYDIAARTPATPIVKNGAETFRPGYPTWNRETTEFLLSDGFGNDSLNMNAEPGAFERISPQAMHVGYAQAGTLRGTTPDWAPDDSQVVFAVPPNMLVTPPANGYWMKTRGPADDLWFAGASLQVATWNDTSKSLESPTVLVQQTGTQNYYYPSFSPEGSLIAFNFAPDGPNFHNPKARVQLVANGQANPTPTDLAKLNDTGELTNSWARWAPFVQNYKGGRILWMTTSSTPNYGLRIINDGKQNCYPKESPKGVAPIFIGNTMPMMGMMGMMNVENPICSRTQLWMAGIRLDAAAVKAGTDVSYPAFFLPFQDQTTNNHLGQWAQRSFSGTCTTAADCGMGRCCDNGGCTTCPAVPPPNPICGADSNCAPTECCREGSCSPSCQGTSPPDGGTGTPPAGCNTCIDCGGQACVNGACGDCTNSADCCAPLVRLAGRCVGRQG